MTGTVYSGINNIYDIRNSGGDALECRIKGKILRHDTDSYNPLAPGDRVEFEHIDQSRGLITARLERSNRFARWNRKRRTWQIVAANMDGLLAVISSVNPPFRPRFVDRVLIAAAQGGIPSIVLVNKIDQGVDSWVSERAAVWTARGTEVIWCSAATGEGLDELAKRITGGTFTLFGPSGVGKSTLINSLIPGLSLNTGTLSKKYDRGRHITNFGRIVDSPRGFRLIDTPGVREILVRGIEPADLADWFPEFREVAKECSFQPCSHRHEPDCRVRQSVREGIIHPDRYENYLRILDELEDRTRW